MILWMTCLRFDGHLEDDFDFLRTLTIVCSVALFGALGFYTWMIYTGEISLVGPSALVLEKDEDFDSLIDTNQSLI